MSRQSYAVKFFINPEDVLTVRLDAESEEDALAEAEKHVPLDRYLRYVCWMVCLKEDET